MTSNNFNPTALLSKLEREYIKAKLQQVFQSENLIKTIKIDSHGRFNIETVKWKDYWANLSIDDPNLKSMLHNLKRSRKTYIASKFQYKCIHAYCYSYFVLLSYLMNQLMTLQSSKHLRILLSKLLSLENFNLSHVNCEKNGFAAGTASHRNPSYLLAKLSNFNIRDDPKYLPLIFIPQNSNNNLFYHYRQYKICDNPGFSLFLYPAVCLEYRAESFNLIETFSKSISNKSDPRSQQRATRIAGELLFPFLKNYCSNNGLTKKEISMVDLGGGNGALLSHIWKYIQNNFSDIACNWHLSCSLIGLRVQNPVRHFKRGLITNNMSYLYYDEIDYRKWVEKKKNTNKHEFDIALICRLLNNISKFNIRSTDNPNTINEIVQQHKYFNAIEDTSYLPINCLNPQTLDTNKLILTNGKIILNDERVYKSLSLTNYYRGILCCTTSEILSEKTLCYPARKFNPESLELFDGSSLLNCLSKVSKLIAIEDADINNNDLIEHFEKHKINNLIFTEVNQNPKCTSRIYAICNKKFNQYLPLRA